MTKDKNTKSKKEIVYTPKGVTSYVWLHKPDTKYNEEGTYSVTVKLDRKEAEKTFAPYVKKLNEAFEEFKADNPKKAKAVHMRDIFSDTEDDDIVEFKAKSSYQPIIVDTKGNKVHPVPKIGGGSVVKLALTVSAPNYMGARNEMGITFYLAGVQLLSVQEFGASGGGLFGATDEGDYEAPEETEGNTKGTADDEDSNFDY